MPLPAAIALLVGGSLLVVATKHHRTGRLLGIAGILLLLFTSHRQVGFHLLSPLETQYPAIPEFSEHSELPIDLAACQYIVVLGGGHTDFMGMPATSKLSPYALSRLTEAVRLARVLPTAKLIVLGPGRPNQDTHAHVLATAAISLGIDKHRIIENSQGRDTEGEAIVLRALINETPFALVTSAWHMPRSMGLMRKVGLNPLACPTNYQARINPSFNFQDWLWGIDGLERSSWAIYEHLGTLWGKLRGRI